jgi:hypothetical protein
MRLIAGTPPLAVSDIQKAELDVLCRSRRFLMKRLTRCSFLGGTSELAESVLIEMSTRNVPGLFIRRRRMNAAPGALLTAEHLPE